MKHLLGRAETRQQLVRETAGQLREQIALLTSTTGPETSDTPDQQRGNQHVDSRSPAPRATLRKTETANARAPGPSRPRRGSVPP